MACTRDLLTIELAIELRPDRKSQEMMHRKRPLAMRTMRVSQRLIRAQTTATTTTKAIQAVMLMKVLSKDSAASS